MNYLYSKLILKYFKFKQISSKQIFKHFNWNLFKNLSLLCLFSHLKRFKKS